MKLFLICGLCLWFILYEKVTGRTFMNDGFDEDDDEYELDATGSVIPQDRRSPEPTALSVTFENGYDEDIELFWINPDNDERFVMGDIPSHSSLGINTFAKHSFAGVLKDSETPANPRKVTIDPNRLKYAFTPSNHASRGSSSVKPPRKAPPAEFKRKSSSAAVRHEEESNDNEEEEEGGDFSKYDVPKPFMQYLNKVSTSASAKFRSLVPQPVDVWYDNGADGSYQGSLSLGKEYTVNSYEGHVFFFTPKGNKKKVLARHTVKKDQVLYIVEDPDNPAPPAMLEHNHKEEQFMSEYQNRTGVQWRHYFSPEGVPRGPPALHMWPAKEIGQKHHVKTSEGYWTCLNYGNPELCHSKEPIDLTLEVISTTPKIFIIKNFLSESEVEGVINYAKPKMDSSYVGNRDAGGARKSETRTSENTWVSRAGTVPIMETLYHRAEELLNITRLDHRNTEDVQVVHYLKGQKYDAHHDWGVSGYAESRFVTLLLYLTDMVSQDAGGETAFPKAGDGRGLKIHPGKGNAVMFYNLLEDGNGDDLTLHAALPVKKGEKWLCNFWVWDPKRK